MFELTPADPPESNMEPHISITVITNVPWEKYHLHIIYTIHKQTNHEFFLFPWWAEVKGDRSPAAIERWANITERRGRSHVFFFAQNHGRQVDIWRNVKWLICESGGYLICVPVFLGCWDIVMYVEADCWIQTVLWNSNPWGLIARSWRLGMKSRTTKLGFFTGVVQHQHASIISYFFGGP